MYYSGYSTILWAWALDAPQFHVPEGIAFKVGAGTQIKHIVMEVSGALTFDQNTIFLKQPLTTAFN